METKQISLKLPVELHARLKAAAARSHRSLHAEIIWRLEQQSSSGLGEPQA